MVVRIYGWNPILRIKCHVPAIVARLRYAGRSYLKGRHSVAALSFVSTCFQNEWKREQGRPRSAAPAMWLLTLNRSYIGAAGGSGID